METMQASEFKARCLGVLDHVAATGESVTITKRGRVVARLVPAPAESRAQFPQLELLGSVRSTGDLLGPVVDEADWGADAENL
jgi:prevent-host-death family protein